MSLLITSSLYFTEINDHLSAGVIRLCETFPDIEKRIYVGESFDLYCSKEAKTHLTKCKTCKTIIIDTEVNELLNLHRYAPAFIEEDWSYDEVMVIDINLSVMNMRKYYSQLSVYSTPVSCYADTAEYIGHEDVPSEYFRTLSTFVYLPVMTRCMVFRGCKLYKFASTYKDFILTLEGGNRDTYGLYDLNNYISLRSSDDSLYEEFRKRFTTTPETVSITGVPTLPTGLAKYFFRVILRLGVPGISSTIILQSSAVSIRQSILFYAYKTLGKKDTTVQEMITFLRRMNTYMSSVFSRVNFLDEQAFRTSNVLHFNISQTSLIHDGRQWTEIPGLFNFFYMERRFFAKTREKVFTYE